MKIKVKTKPLSLNHAYPTNRYGRRYLTNEGKAYKAEIGFIAKTQCAGPLTENIGIKFIFGFADRRRRDIDDYIKLAQDSLTDIWYKDDRQIVELSAKKVYSEDYFVEIEMYKLVQTS